MQLFLCGLSLIQMFNLKEIFNLIFSVSGKLISREKKFPLLRIYLSRNLQVRIIQILSKYKSIIVKFKISIFYVLSKVDRLYSKYNFFPYIYFIIKFVNFFF